MTDTSDDVSIPSLRPAIEHSLLHYLPVKGHTIAKRCTPFTDWVNARRSLDIFPYGRVLGAPAARSTLALDHRGGGGAAVLNFASQDYLGLAQDKRAKEAAIEAIEEFGMHSAGSPVLAGRTRLLVEFEQQLCRLVNKPASVVFPTGWAAGFGCIAGMVRQTDTVLIDALAHNCLQEGARHATSHVHLFRHNSVDQLAKLLASVRESNCHAGIFVVIEGLYSMDSDIPDLASIVRLAREFEAIVIVDVAHDFGSTGKGGLGALGELEPSGYPDIIMGSFSKTFASNGGFIAGPEAAIEYIRCFAATHVFSNAISPMQTKVAQRCLDIVFSAEGELRRQQLRRNVELLRSSAIQCGLSVGGIASPICPIFVGKEILARFTARFLQERNVLANLVEFPAVPRAKARFRFQMMSTHLETDICRATEALAESKLRAFAFIRASRGLLGSVEMPD